MTTQRLNWLNGKLNTALLMMCLTAGLHIPVLASEVAQTPLFVSSSVEPNILFILDDSGSMYFEVTPDELSIPGTSYSGFVYPRADNVYGDHDYTQTFIQVSSVDENAYAAMTRSPQTNTTYYNPSKTYTPWIKHDGTFYPNASASCAPHNPAKTGSCPTGTTSVNSYARNLTINNSRYNSNRWRTCNASSCSSSTDAKTFWPATYYWFTGSTDNWDWTDTSTWNWNLSAYTKIEIRSTTANYSGHGREKRTDCANGVCTYAQEIQNFANWYTYYRSRMLASRAGIGQAFHPQGGNIRVGFGTINQHQTTIDNQNNTGTIVRGVRNFSGTNRETFFSDLYTRNVIGGGTPLRRALDDAGQYYSRTDDRGPWSTTPGSAGGTDLVCRQSYTILMTDGYWTGDSDSAARHSSRRANIDNTTGDTILGPDGKSYTYEPVDPYKDDQSNTLADIAMYYWNRDLRPDLENRVPISEQNEAFWQHMVTFGVGLGVNGAIDPDLAWEAVKNNTAINWGDVNASQSNCSGATCAARLDDLLHAAINSRGGFFSAADPETFATELQDVLRNIVVRTETSTTAIASNSTFLNTESRLYQARFDSTDWSGDLVAFSPIIENHSLSLIQEWSAANLLNNRNPETRNIVTHNGTGTGNNKGINFLWSSISSHSGLTQALSSTGTNTERENIVQYIRGEDVTGFRVRNNILGDIINSNPIFSHREHYGYHTLGGAGSSTYNQYVLNTKTTRPKMIYVGANDGMLHGFNADTGEEVFAYIPSSVFPNLKNLTDQNYDHKYFVDGNFHISDAYINGSWRTILLGTTGAGGKSVFALDISNPINFGPSNVLWEFSDPELGYTLGTPVIGRLKDGTWAAVFGNGYSSTSHKAQLFIVNLATGQLERKIDTGAGTTATRNGLSEPAYINITDGNELYMGAVYAGDLLGNMWKFDLTHNNKGNWNVAFTQNGNNPLFTAKNSSNQPQPITVRPEIRRHPSGGHMILFGTGKYFSLTDPADMTVQSIYGIRDTGTRITQTDRSTLQQQSIIYRGPATGLIYPVTAVSNNPVNYSGTGTQQRGWYMDLIYPADIANAKGERVITNPRVWFDRLRVSTTIPGNDPCSPAATSWNFELNLLTGGRLSYNVFDLNADGSIDAGDSIVIDGVTIPVSAFGQDGVGNLPTQIGDFIAVDTEDESANIGYLSGLRRIDGRQTWREVR